MPFFFPRSFSFYLFVRGTRRCGVLMRYGDVKRKGGHQNKFLEDAFTIHNLFVWFLPHRLAVVQKDRNVCFLCFYALRSGKKAVWRPPPPNRSSRHQATRLHCRRAAHSDNADATTRQSSKAVSLLPRFYSTQQLAVMLRIDSSVPRCKLQRRFVSQ